MLIFVLILILIAILYSTERGRGLLEDILLLPFKIIGYPFRLIHEEKERAQAEQLAQEEQKDKDKIKILLSKNQLATLDQEEIENSWSWNKKEIIKQAKFFESILEGGQDPRILNLGEYFSYVDKTLLEKTKENLIDSGKNLTPEILQYIRQYIRKQMKDTPLKYEEIREKLGKTPVIGKQTKTRIAEVLKASTDLDNEQINEIVDYALENLR
jgi:cell division protein FtsB